MMRPVPRSPYRKQKTYDIYYKKIVKEEQNQAYKKLINDALILCEDSTNKESYGKIYLNDSTYISFMNLHEESIRYLTLSIKNNESILIVSLCSDLDIEVIIGSVMEDANI